MKKALSIIILFSLIFFSCEKENEDININEPISKVTDIDNNVYDVVKIGEQIWMAENLKTTKFSNGDPISNITNNSDWKITINPAWAYFQNNELRNEIHGKLYNWFTANDSRNCCPNGWRVPNESDFLDLVQFLGGEEIAGGKLKQSGTSNWISPNTGATNETGFNGLPSSYRYDDGFFDELGHGVGYWVKDQNLKWFFLRYDNSKFSITDFGTKNGGISIRCIKN